MLLQRRRGGLVWGLLLAAWLPFASLAAWAQGVQAVPALTAHVMDSTGTLNAAAQWQAMVARMAGAFREKRYEDGLTQALEETSAVLVAHFARTDSSLRHPNELPDTPLLL